MPDELKGKVKQIADAYHAATGKKLTVTDGPRTAGDQAEAIYDKLNTDGEQKVRKLYHRNPTLISEIIDACKSTNDKGAPVQAMTQKIDEQMKDGKYISRHLRNGAVDVRSRAMSASDRRAFKKAVSESPGADVVDETDSAGAHYHVQF